MWVFKTFFSRYGKEKQPEKSQQTKITVGEKGELSNDGRPLISGAEGWPLLRVSHGRTQTPRVNNGIEHHGARAAALLTGTHRAR